MSETEKLRKHGENIVQGVVEGFEAERISVAELRRAYEAKYELKKGRDIPSGEIHELSLSHPIVHRALEMCRRGDATYIEALEAAVQALVEANKRQGEWIEQLQRPRAVFTSTKPY